MNSDEIKRFAAEHEATLRPEFERQHKGRDLSRHRMRGTYMRAHIAALWNQHVRSAMWMFYRSRREQDGPLLSQVRDLAEKGMCHGLLADDYCEQIVRKIDANAQSAQLQPTYYVAHPDGSYTVANPQPQARDRAKEPRIPIEAERKAAEQAYTAGAFNYPENPVGSRDWTLYWAGWLERSTTALPTSTSTTTDHTDDGEGKAR